MSDKCACRTAGRGRSVPAFFRPPPPPVDVDLSFVAARSSFVRASVVRCDLGADMGDPVLKLSAEVRRVFVCILKSQCRRKNKLFLCCLLLKLIKACLFSLYM